MAKAEARGSAADDEVEECSFLINWLREYNLLVPSFASGPISLLYNPWTNPYIQFRRTSWRLFLSFFEENERLLRILDVEHPMSMSSCLSLSED